MSKYVAAIDQGTTSTRCMLFDHQGRTISLAQEEHRQIYPEPGLVEHDPLEIWQRTQNVIRKAVSKAGVKSGDILAVGITNQRETSLIWDRNTGKPFSNAIVWQDTRTKGICDQLAQDGGQDRFRGKVGLPLATYFSGPKIKWILDNVTGVRDAAERGQALFGNLDTWLIWWLTGGPKGGTHVTDVTNASRTMLMDLNTLNWDSEILSIMGIPPQILPQIVSSSDPNPWGSTAKDGPFGDQIPVCGDLGDQQAATLGQICFSAGEAKNTYGTGCFLLLNVADKKIIPESGLILTLACDPNGKPSYALEGSVFVAGAVVQWLRDGLGIITRAEDTQAIAQSIDNSQGVYVVPAFAGLGAPHWDMYARGGILGITRGTPRAHIVRAALEGIAFQIKDLMGAFEKVARMRFQELRVDGGACRNDFLMQFQADILGCPINRSRYIESTGMGAAFLAGLATEFWSSSSEIENLRKSDKIFYPAIKEADRDRLYQGWMDAVRRVKSKKN